MNKRHEMISCKVGMKIRALRTKRRMSQETLALNSDMHPAYLGKIERGEKCPTVETLYKISLGLKVPISYLLDFDNETEQSPSEAVHRISSALSGLDENSAVKIAEIVEEIVELYKK